MYLILDLETTGLINFQRPIYDDSQPHIVSLGAVVCSLDMSIIDVMYKVIKPQGLFTIPKEVFAIHGISTEFAEAHGIPFDQVMLEFSGLASKAKFAFSYNWQFDNSMLARHCEQDILFHHKTGCIMKACTGICKIPKKAGNGFKFPKLEEAASCLLKQSGAVQHHALLDTLLAQRLLKVLMTDYGYNPEMEAL